MFEQSMIRFALSGTLILLLGLSDHVARRRSVEQPKRPSPRWVKPLIFVWLGAYYLLIGPTGGSLLGGVANVIGIGLCMVSFAVRLLGGVRYPDLASRNLFYVALPIAVGVPWGLLALSLPACLASFYCCRLAEQERLTRAIEPGAGPRFRMLHGIW
jgi:hypothetical protein